MPAVTNHGPSIATATPTTEASHAGRAGRSGACYGNLLWRFLSSSDRVG